VIYSLTAEEELLANPRSKGGLQDRRVPKGEYKEENIECEAYLRTAFDGSMIICHLTTAVVVSADFFQVSVTPSPSSTWAISWDVRSGRRRPWSSVRGRGGQR